MAKKPKKQLSPERKELISKLIDEFDPKSVKDIEDMFKDMFSPMLQEMLEGELDDHLGYEKYEHSGESVSKSRNGHTSKRVTASTISARAFYYLIIYIVSICSSITQSATSAYSYLYEVSCTSFPKQL